MSYDSPVVTSFSPFMVPPGGGDIEIYGLNFGPFDSSPTVLIRSTHIITPCVTTSWLSTSALNCYLPRANRETDLLCATCSAAFSPIITVATVVGTTTFQFSYDPSVPADKGSNSPTTGGALVRFQGADFDAVDRTATVVVGSTACLSTTWTSWTTLGCYTAGGIGLNSVKSYYSYSVGTTVSEMVGTLGRTLSYDAPAITVVRGLDVATLISFGFEWAIVQGFNLGISDATPTAKLHSTQCITSHWTSDSSLSCYYAPYDSQAATFLDAIVTVADLPGCRIGLFSYAQSVAPTLLLPANGPHTGGSELTLSGANFGGADYSASLLLHQTMCATTSWISWTLLGCTSAAGENWGFSSERTVSFQIAAVDHVGVPLGLLFTYDSPVVTATSEHILAPPGYQDITVLGVNFGLRDPTPSLRVCMCCPTPCAPIQSVGLSLSTGVTIVVPHYYLAELDGRQV